nr:hypothetical protein [Tanacetum cinerariifolium]
MLLMLMVKRFLMVEVITTAKIIIDEVSTAGGSLNAANEEPFSVAPTNITTAHSSEATKITVDITTAPKTKGIVFHDMEEQSDDVRKYQALKRKPVSVAQARKNMMIYLNNEGTEMDVERIIALRNRTRKEKVEKDQTAKKKKSDELEKDNAEKQKLEEQQEAEELKRNLEIVPDDEDDEGKNEHFQIIRANGNHQMYLAFSTMLKNFDREDLEVLWKIVKDRFKESQPKEVLDVFLWHTLKVMFEHFVEDSIWKLQKGPKGLDRVNNWKLFDSCGVYCVTLDTIQLYLLAEKMYLLTNYTLQQMFNEVRLQVDYEVEMAYDLLRLVSIIVVLDLSRITKSFNKLIKYLFETGSTSGKFADIDIDEEFNLENVCNLDMAHEETVLSMQDVTDANGKEVAKEMVKVVTTAKIIVDEVSTAGDALNGANEEPIRVNNKNSFFKEFARRIEAEWNAKIKDNIDLNEVVEQEGSKMDAERIIAPRKRTRKEKVEKDQTAKKKKGDELEKDNAEKQNWKNNRKLKNL